MRDSRSPLPSSSLALRRLYFALAILPLAALVYTATQRTFENLAPSTVMQLIMAYVVPAVAGSAAMVALALARRSLQVLVLPYLAAAVLAAYAAEAYLTYSRFSEMWTAEPAAKRFGFPFDPRSPQEVIRDLQAQGIDARPMFRILTSPDLVPLGNTPDKTIVVCNELGPYLVIKADRHGFNNPDAVWDDANIDTVVVGDSFTQGYCIPDNRNFVSLLREKGFSPLNVGIGGNEPMTNLAALVEYVPHFRAKHVVWVHYAGNDLAGFMARKNHPILKKYLDAGYTQDLVRRRDEVLRLMESFYVKNPDVFFGGDVLDPAARVFKWEYLSQILKFTLIRRSLGLTADTGDDVDFVRLERVMRRAQDFVSSTGAVLHFVNLPAPAQVLWPNDHKDIRVREIVEAAGIVYHDLTPVFAREGVAAIYPSGRRGGHLTPRASEIVAEQLAIWLKETPARN